MSPRQENKPVKLVRKRLDDAGVARHFESLAGAQAIEVRIKDAGGDYSSDAAEPLEVAARRLRAGELVAVQVRFFQDGAWWCDTVMRADHGFRLVRMRQSEPPDGDPAGGHDGT